MSTVLNKPDIISIIAEKTGESKAAVGRVLNSLESTVIDAVRNDREVKISGFVAFESAVRSARTMKNPRTGEDLDVPEQKVVRVRTLSRLRNSLRDDSSDE